MSVELSANFFPSSLLICARQSNGGGVDAVSGAGSGVGLGVGGADAGGGTGLGAGAGADSGPAVNSAINSTPSHCLRRSFLGFCNYGKPHAGSDVPLAKVHVGGVGVALDHLVPKHASPFHDLIEYALALLGAEKHSSEIVEHLLGIKVSRRAGLGGGFKFFPGVFHSLKSWKE